MKRARLSKALSYVLLALGAVVMVLPMVYMFTTSLRSNDATFSWPPRIFPTGSDLTFANYRYVLSEQNFVGYLSNTLFVAVVTTLATAVVASMLAYCIARLEFHGRRLLYGTIITTMLVPGLAMLVPQFELAVTFKLVDDLWGVIFFYSAWMTPFSTFLIKGFIDTIPRELDEAVRIDGGSIYTIFFRVIVPLASPSIAAVSIFNFLLPFEELGWSQTILKTDALRTMPVAITMFFQAHNRTDWGFVFAMTCCAMVPVILLYVLLQRYFITGLTSGAIKG